MTIPFNKGSEDVLDRPGHQRRHEVRKDRHKRQNTKDLWYLVQRLRGIKDRVSLVTRHN